MFACCFALVLQKCTVNAFSECYDVIFLLKKWHKNLYKNDIEEMPESVALVSLCSTMKLSEQMFFFFNYLQLSISYIYHLLLIWHLENKSKKCKT